MAGRGLPELLCYARLDVASVGQRGVGYSQKGILQWGEEHGDISWTRMPARALAKTRRPVHSRACGSVPIGQTQPRHLNHATGKTALSKIIARPKG
jgi:hypothetical protein